MVLWCSKYGSKRFGGLVRSEINSQAASPLNELSDDTEISRSQFEDLLTKIDKGLRALPATAQVSSCHYAFGVPTLLEDLYLTLSICAGQYFVTELVAQGKVAALWKAL